MRIHASLGRAGRVHAPQRGEALAIDDRAHLQPHPRPTDHEPQRERGDRGRDEHRELIGAEVHTARDVEDLRRLRPETGRDPADRRRVGDLREVEAERAVPDGLDEPEREGRKCDEQPDRADDARVHRRGCEPSEQHVVERQPEQRSEDENGEDRGGDDRDALTRVHLVVEERRRERHRAVREVEDARGLEGEHQARGHDRIDRAGDGTGEDQVPELLHRRTSKAGSLPDRTVAAAGPNGPAAAVRAECRSPTSAGSA